MSDVGAPNDIEHKLISNRSEEKFQHLVEQEVAQNNARIDMWPEHWDDAGAVDVWKCSQCHRLFYNAYGKPEEIIIYNVEQHGLDSSRVMSRPVWVKRDDDGKAEERKGL